MAINTLSLNLIKEFEGCKLLAYADAVGVPTIGYGHTRTVSRADVGKKRITQSEADRLLMQFDLPTYEAAVKRLVKVPLTANQYGALVSFTYNLGETNLSKSTLLKRINSRAPIAEIERSWLQWNKAGGKVLNGLTRRRQAEVALFKR